MPPIYGTFKVALPPNAPLQLDPTNVGYNSVVLNWSISDPGNVEDFCIFIDGVLVVDEGIGPDQRSYELTGLNPNTFYESVICSRNGAGISEFSNAKNFNTTSIPSDLLITQHPVSNSVDEGSNASFSVAGTGIDFYQWQVNDGASWSDIVGATSSTLNLSSVTLAINGYQYRCVVSDDYENSLTSNAATLTVVAAGLVAPSGLTAALEAGPQVRLDWSDNSSAEDNYEIYRNGVLIDTIAASSETYTDTGVSLGNSYSYQVAALKLPSERAFSNSVNISLVEASILFSPTDEYVSDGTTATFGVTSDPNAGTPTYQWEYSDNSGSSWSDVPGGTSRDLDVSATTGIDGRWYRCKVTTGAGTATSGHAVLTVYAHAYPGDVFTMVGAYGYKKLKSAYAGDCVRLRRSLDNAEADFGFSGDVLDVAAVEAWANGGEAWVVKRYDLSGNGKTANIVGKPPILVIDGTVNTDQFGHICDIGDDIDGTSFWEANFTGSEIDGNAFSGMMLIDSDTDRKNEISEYTNGLPFAALGPFGSEHTAGIQVNTGLNVGYADTAVNKPLDVPMYATHWFSWSLPERKVKAYAGLMYLEPGNSSDQKYWDCVRSNSYSGLRFTAMRGIRFREAVFYGDSPSDSDLLDRVIYCDRNYRNGPPNKDYQYLRAITADTHKLLQVVDQISESLLDYPKVASKTATHIVVNDVDWSHLTEGRKMMIETVEYSVDVDGAVYDGAGTTIPILGGTVSISVGDMVMPYPYYDQSSASRDEANRILRSFGAESGLGLSGIAQYPSHYFLLNDPAATKLQIPATRKAVISSASPDSTGLTGGIKDDGVEKKVVLIEFDLSTLVDRPKFAAVVIDEADDDATDANRPYIGVLLLNNGTFDESTVTWNTSPIDFSTGYPAYDELEAFDPVELNHTIELTAKIQEAYDAGATTLVVALYRANQTAGRTPTSKETTISGISGIHLLSTNRFYIGCDQKAGIFSLNNYDRDGRHHQSTMLIAATWDANVPLADGKQGNCFYHSNALLMRSLSQSLVLMSQLSIMGGWSEDTRATGGKYHMVGYALMKFAQYLDDRTRRSLEECLHKIAVQLKNSAKSKNFLSNNANMTMKGIEGGAQCWMAVRPSNTRVRDRIKKSLLYVFFGDESGQIDTAPYNYDPLQGIFATWGNTPEGPLPGVYVDPEIDYGGRAFAHLASAANATANEPEFAVLKKAVDRFVRFFGATVMSDGSHGWVSASGYSGRTHGVPFLISQYTDFGLFAVAAMKAEHQWLARFLKGDDVAPLLGTTLEEANSRASSAVNGTTNSAIVDMEFPRGSGNRPFPWRMRVVGQAWPVLPPELPETSGWEATLANAFAADDASTYYPGHMKKNWSDLVEILGDYPTYDTPIVSVQKGNAPYRYKTLLYAPSIIGENGGAKFAHPDFFEVEDYGPVFSCIKISSKSDYWGDPVGEYTAYTNDAFDIHGNYASGDEFMFSGGYKASELVNRSWDPVTNTFSGTKRISNKDWPIDHEWVLTSAMRVMDPTGSDSYHGIEWSLDLDYTPSGSPVQISALHLQLPVFVSKRGKLVNVSIDYWSGSTWIPTPVRGEWLGPAQHFRLRRNRLDGSGEFAAYFSLSSPREFRMYPVDTTKNDQVTRRLWIDLHPNNGVATNIPASISEVVKFYPESPGLFPSGPGASFTNVLPGGNIEAGLMWLLNAYVIWGGATPVGVFADYSTDYAGDEGAATWTSIGEFTPASGSYDDGEYSFVGGVIPAGVTGIRTVVKSVEYADATNPQSATAGSSTVYVTDSFTDIDLTLLNNHTPDTDLIGGGWIDPATDAGNGTVRIASNAAESGSASSANGTFRSISVGSEQDDYQLEAKVVCGGWDVSALDSGPWIGGRCRNRDTDGLRVQLSHGGVNVCYRKTGAASTGGWIYTSFTDYVPVAGTTYLLKVRLLKGSIGFELRSSDGSTLHASGSVHNLLPEMQNPYPAIGFTKRSTAGGGQKIDDLTIRV